MFNFEKLETWQKAIHFADLVYRQTRAFPDEERFGLTSQMRRAAVPRTWRKVQPATRTRTSPDSWKSPPARCLKWCHKPLSVETKAS
jgi:hypothetical protein